MTADEDDIWNALENGLAVVTQRPAALRAQLADFENLLKTDAGLAGVRFDDAAFVDAVETSLRRLGRGRGAPARRRLFALAMERLGGSRTVGALRGQLADVVKGAGLGRSNREAVAAALVCLAPALTGRRQVSHKSSVLEIIFNVQLDGWLERRLSQPGATDDVAQRFVTTGRAAHTAAAQREPRGGAALTASIDRTFSIPHDYGLEAARRADLGRPVSEVLRKARREIKVRGWAPRRVHEIESRARSRGPVDVLTALQIAAMGDPNAQLELPDYYALLAPIALVIPSALTTWELQPDLQEHAVLAMMDTAIAFAIQAECSQDPEVAARLDSKRGSN